MKNKKTLVIYHGDCNDGFGAAYAAWKFFGDNAEYLPGEYGLDNNFPFDKVDVKNRDVIILDFSYSRDCMEQLLKEANHVRLLDHHKSAQEVLGEMDCCYFDMNKSGAMLAWEFFHPKKAVPYFIELIQDRDLWLKKYEDSEYFFMISNLLPKTFDVWKEYEDHHSSIFKKHMQDGKLLFNYHMVQVIDTYNKCAQKITVGGHTGYIVNCNTLFVSDLGSYLSRKEGTFAILWHENKNGLISCSLRSDENFNSLPLNVYFGGGGHKQSSGSKIASYKEFKDSLKELEHTNIEGFGPENLKKKIKP